jgi:hypothetical protein
MAPSRNRNPGDAPGRRIAEDENAGIALADFRGSFVLLHFGRRSSQGRWSGTGTGLVVEIKALVHCLGL